MGNAWFKSPVNIKLMLDLIDLLVRTIIVRILPNNPTIPTMTRKTPSNVVL